MAYAFSPTLLLAAGICRELGMASLFAFLLCSVAVCVGSFGGFYECMTRSFSAVSLEQLVAVLVSVCTVGYG